MNHLIDSNTTNATLHRLTSIAKARRLALNQILRESRNAGSLNALRSQIEQILDTLQTTEEDVISHT